MAYKTFAVLCLGLLCLQATADARILRSHLDDEFENRNKLLSDIVTTSVDKGFSSIDTIFRQVNVISIKLSESAVEEMTTTETEALVKLKSVEDNPNVNRWCVLVIKDNIKDVTRKSWPSIGKCLTDNMSELRDKYNGGASEFLSFHDMVERYRSKYYECQDDACKQEVLDRVNESIVEVPYEVEGIVNKSREVMEMLMSTILKDRLIPLLNQLDAETSSLVEKASAICLK